MTASDQPVQSPAASHQPDALAALLRDADGQDPSQPAPLEKWNPSYCASMDLVIRENGDWYHEGTPITRQNLINLFARVLWREQDTDQDTGQDRYFLKTPAEKIEIQVEDAPLLVSQVEQAEADGQQWIRCTTRTGDRFLLDAAHPLMMRDFAGQQRPYIRVRRNLDALVHRNAFYHLIDMAQPDGQGELWLTSGNQRFSLGRLDEPA